MSQYDNPYANVGADHGDDIPKRTSGLAVASLVCSLVCCIPALPAVGALLGLGSFVAIGRNVMLRGRGLAIAGILLGILITVGQVVVGSYSYKVFMFIAMGPQQALTAGLTGDVAGFKSNFHGAGATAADAEAQAFLRALTDRYGALNTIHPVQQQQGGTFGQPVVKFPYVAEFENGQVDVDVEIAFSDPKQGGFILKMVSITVHDPDKGDLTFPPKSVGDGG